MRTLAAFGHDTRTQKLAWETLLYGFAHELLILFRELLSGLALLLLLLQLLLSQRRLRLLPAGLACWRVREEVSWQACISVAKLRKS